MIKKITFALTGLLVLAVFTVTIITRTQGIMIRTSNGLFVGYSFEINQWLFFEYPNFPVGHDGPYVFKEDGRYTALTIVTTQAGENTLMQQTTDQRITVVVDSPRLTQFTVDIRDSHPRSALDIPAPEKRFAVSDLEGNFEAFQTLLQSQRIIDKDLNWQFATGHLVIVGDMVDRGENVVPLLWLIYKLEGQARQAGGAVHYILGNHERYLLDGRTKSAAPKYYGSFHTAGLSSSQAWSEGSILGDWLRSKPVMLKIGDTLYVHGGVSPGLLDQALTLAQLDALAARDLVLKTTHLRNIAESPIHANDGVLYYRGLAKSMEEYGFGPKATTSHVDKVLAYFDVKHIAIGHTLVPHIGTDYQGKVLRLDVAHAEGVIEGLWQIDGALWRADDEGDRFPLYQIDEYPRTNKPS